MEPPLEFFFVAVFRNDFTFSVACVAWQFCRAGGTSGFHLLYKMKNILKVVALLGACDVTNNCRNLSRHLGFYQELQIRLKPREMVVFCA